MIWGDQVGCRTYPPGPASCSRDWLWGRMAWVRRDSAAQSSCTERLRLRHVPRPCQPAPTPGQQPQPSKGHLEQKARPGKQHVRSHSGPSLTLWACAHSSLPQLSSPQTDQVHHPTSLPAPLPQPSLYTKTKQNVFHHCLPANSFLKKTFWRKPQMPQARPVILSPQEQAWGLIPFCIGGPSLDKEYSRCSL